MPVARTVAVCLLIVLSACTPAPLAPTPTPAVAPPTPVPTSPATKPTVAASPAPSVAPPAVGTTRVDLFNAASTALASGRTDEAIGLYERVINTPGAPGEPTVLDEFAHFRAIVALLAAGREDQARQQLDALQSRDATAPVARLANQLWDQYGMTASVKAACAQLQPQVASQAGPVLSTLRGLGVSVDPANLCGIG